VLSGGPLATAHDSDDCRFIAHFSRGGSTRLAHVSRVNTFLPPPNAGFARPSSTTVLPVDTTDFAASRAPPLAAS